MAVICSVHPVVFQSVGIALAVAITALSIASIVLESWIVAAQPVRIHTIASADIRYGIWRYCVTLNGDSLIQERFGNASIDPSGQSDCVDLPGENLESKVTNFLAIFFGILTSIMSIVSTCNILSPRKRFYSAIASMATSSIHAGLMVAVLIIWSYKLDASTAPIQVELNLEKLLPMLAEPESLVIVLSGKHGNAFFIAGGSVGCSVLAALLFLMAAFYMIPRSGHMPVTYEMESIDQRENEDSSLP
eukprot:scpid21267/ scgid32874/ 